MTGRSSSCIRLLKIFFKAVNIDYHILYFCQTTPNRNTNFSLLTFKLTLNPNQDNLISNLTVRLRESKLKKVIGTGVIYSSENLKDRVYIITASHCLHSDAEAFDNIFDSILIDFYNSVEGRYSTIEINAINQDLLFKDADKDIAIIIIDKNDMQNLIKEIPKVRVVANRQSHKKFIVKGFPNATMGKELAAIYPTWNQEMTEVNKFQLQFQEDYDSYSIQGFSGSGVFLYDEHEIYLHGIFTRFRAEDRGKVIYCQHIELVNELLQQNFLPTIQLDYIGDNNLNNSFFKTHIEKAIENLGQRYSETLNLELPISKLFNDLVRDYDFEYRFLQIFDDWFTKARDRTPKSNSELFEVINKQNKFKNDVKSWLGKTSFKLPFSIEISWIIEEIQELNQMIRDNRLGLYERQQELMKKEKEEDKNAYNYRRPFETEISQLSKIESNNEDFESNLKWKVNIELTNFPVFILKGEAGSGKSHLLGDIAHHRLKRNLPSILLLGQHFKPSKSVEANVNELLGLECNFETTLKSLNQIGQQLGQRIPIFIDALNEGGGVDLWKGEILGFIKLVSEYPFLGLVLSIRTTYFDLLLPESLDSKITIKNHEGFKGNEYAALKLFCEHYGLKQPDFPILAPEFTKPLFLVLICKGVQNSPKKEFPQGFQGIGTIFRYYISALENRFKTLRTKYRLTPNIISTAIKKFSLECFEKEQTIMLLHETIDFFANEFPRYPFLLNDLIQESVFIRNSKENYDGGEKEEIIYFAFERFGDYFVAEELISSFKNNQEVIDAFSKNARFGKLIEHYYWKYRGVLESLAILLPEVHNLEIFEVYSWVFTETDNNERIYGAARWLNQFLIDGLKWRSVESIDNKKLTDWIKSDFFEMDDDEFLLKLTELTTIKNHPFNSNRLHRILMNHDMPQRDSFWQIHTRLFGGFDDNDIAYPLRRLIDWAWYPEISFKIDQEIATLAAQTLSWVLSSTNRKLRDETTKAIVNLLEQQPDALISILERFRDVGDMYISERLYAIAYGCILRTKDNSAVQKIGNFVYQEVFAKGNPPEHILLRDYARNTVEYLIYKNLEHNVDSKKIRPPYKSKLPKFPSEEDISQFNIENDSPNYDKVYGRIYNRIHFSVMSWDFGEKTVEPKLDKFCPISFTQEKKYKRFLKTLSKEQKKHLADIVEMIENKATIRNKKDHLIQRLGSKEKYENLLNNIEHVISEGYKLIDSLFDKKIDYIKNEIIPYFKNKSILKSRTYHRKLFNPFPVKRWIVQRAFQLGYDIELHGNYDNYYCDEFRHPNVERIGKKYQWIAFHEILSVLTDNYKKRDWSSDREYKYYQGPWEFYARDIDPIYVKRNSEKAPKDEMKILDVPPEWWYDQKYNYWDQENYAWARNINDLPIVKHVIEKKDDLGTEWLFLNRFVQWNEPKPIGIGKYNVLRKEIWYQIKGYLVKKEDKNKIINFLEYKNFWGGWMPEASDEHDQLFNREKYWSPTYKNSDKNESWKEIYYDHNPTGFNVLPCTLDAKAHISNDKSGAEASYSMPCEQLFNDLELNYSLRDGNFEDDLGNIIVQNIPTAGGLMIRKDKFLKYLEENDLDIIWTLLGEKLAFHSPGETNYFGAPCGVFYLEKGLLKGELNHYERD